MEQKELREYEYRCIQEEPPGCTAGCPLAVDARAFVRAMAKADMNGARAVLEKTMPLAGVTGRLCEAPCEPFCLRHDLGGPIAIGLLERSCVSQATRRGKVLCLPARGKKAAVLGGGPSSLTAAFDLSKKGYAVTVYASSAPGGWLKELPEARLPAAVLAEELAGLERMGVRFVTVDGFSLQFLDELRSDCLAVYLGRDDDLGPDLPGLLAGADTETMALPEAGLFAGGLAEADHPLRYIASIAESRAAALSMDRFMQGVSLTADRPVPRRGRTDLFTETKDISPLARIVPQAPTGDFDREEATREAGRCIDCQCLECVRHCVYLEEYGSYPRVYARRVYNNEAIVKGTHQTNTFIDSCSLCGQCTVFCPRDFSMATLCLEARQRMVEEKRMPPSAHAFALDEMRAALGPQAELIRHAPGHKTSAAILFPGCQLAGIRPEQTLGLYRHLLSAMPDTGIWLGCCGAPAHWAGRREEFARIGDEFLQSWRQMGEPRVLTCCSSCLAMFREHLPEVKAEPVWSLPAGVWPAPAGSAAGLPPLALTDPCTARHDPATREAVRTLLTRLGQELVKLPMAGELTECCGFGGLMDNANTELAQKVRERRVSQTEAGFLTYCAMCREQLAKTGKPVLHLLDLLLPDLASPAEEPPQGISARRENRRQLKTRLLKEHFGEQPTPPEPWRAIGLKLVPGLAPVLEKRRILDEDIQRVLREIGKSGRYFEHGSRGTLLAAVRLGEVTFWVEYKRDGDDYLIQRCWSHRMAPAGRA